ncbi:hypothetical protein BH11ARM2_BH11ARM2_37840 [soil metagenome]
MSLCRWSLVALGLLALGGCRLKSWESFSAAVEPVPQGPYKGNEYQSSGLAEATGGIKPEVRYTEGAKNDQESGFASTTDQPAKGSGQHPGELPNVARPGYGMENGPALQNGPSSVGQPGIDSGRGY